jgi:hypothetical protein
MQPAQEDDAPHRVAIHDVTAALTVSPCRDAGMRGAVSGLMQTVSPHVSCLLAVC